MNLLIKPFSKTVQLMIGLVLCFLLSFLSSLPAAASQDDGVVEAAIIGGVSGQSGTLPKELTAPLAQAFDNFRNAQAPQNQATAQNTSNQATVSLPQSTAQAITPDKMVLDSPVLDYARILSPTEKQALSEQLYKIYKDNLAQVALVIVPTTDGVPIFDYTMATARHFGLGREQVDDGVLILVAINDRELFIATGYGVEGVLPDGAIKRIIREDITPSFKTGAYAQGLSAGIARIDERLRADPETLARADKAVAEQENPVDIIGLFVPALIVGLFLSQILGRLIGASIGAGGFAVVALMMGVGLFGVVVGGVVLWLFLLLFSNRGITLPSGSYRSGSHRIGGGGFGSGGIGGGGFSGGGGSFGGGGAGGSW